MSDGSGTRGGLAVTTAGPGTAASADLRAAAAGIVLDAAAAGGPSVACALCHEANADGSDRQVLAYVALAQATNLPQRAARQSAVALPGVAAAESDVDAGGGSVVGGDGGGGGGGGDGGDSGPAGAAAPASAWSPPLAADAPAALQSALSTVSSTLSRAQRSASRSSASAPTATAVAAATVSTDSPYDERAVGSAEAAAAAAGLDWRALAHGYDATAPAGSHVAVCGHALHVACWERYAAALRASAAVDAPYEGRDVADLTAGEYLCPVCRRLANTLLPVVPRGAVGGGRAPLLSTTTWELAPDTAATDAAASGAGWGDAPTATAAVADAEQAAAPLTVFVARARRLAAAPMPLQRRQRPPVPAVARRPCLVRARFDAPS